MYVLEGGNRMHLKFEIVRQRPRTLRLLHWTRVRSNTSSCLQNTIHIHTHIHTHTHTYIYTYIHIHTYTYIYIHIHIHTHIYISTRKRDFQNQSEVPWTREIKDEIKVKTCKVIQTDRESAPIYYEKHHLLNSLCIYIARACSKIPALFCILLNWVYNF